MNQTDHNIFQIIENGNTADLLSGKGGGTPSQPCLICQVQHLLLHMVSYICFAKLSALNKP